jgi:hypothetical protein
MSIEEEFTAVKPSQKCNKIENLKMILQDLWMTNLEKVKCLKIFPPSKSLKYIFLFPV